MTELLPRLFIGNWREAQASSGLHVVTCMNDEPNFSRGEDHDRFGLVDGPGNKVELLVSAISRVRDLYDAGKSVLVHCHGGRSRSACVCVGAIVAMRVMNLCQAYDHVKDRHDITRIHPYLSLLLMEAIKSLS